MNPKLAVGSLEDAGVTRLKIPARTPILIASKMSLTPCERLAIQKDDVNRKIEKENFAQFQTRCMKVIKNLDKNYIDKVIENMPKRIELVIKMNGQRIKY